MDKASDFVTIVGSKFVAALQRVVEYLPNIVAALLIVALGWLIGWILKQATRRVLVGVNRLLSRLLARTAAEHMRLPDAVIRLLAGLIFWVVVIFAIEAAFRVLDIAMASRWISHVIAYIPTLLAGVAILVIGVLASTIIRDVVASATAFVGRAQGVQFGRLAQAVSLTIAIVVALDQIDIDVQLPIALIVVVAAALLGGLSLAFGLGARGYAANLIAAQQAGRQLRPGQAVSICGIEGVVAEITATMIVIDTETGRASVPARLFLEQVATIRETGDTP